MSVSSSKKPKSSYTVSTVSWMDDMHKYHAKRRRHPKTYRALAVAVALGFCYLLFLNDLTPAGWARRNAHALSHQDDSTIRPHDDTSPKTYRNSHLPPNKPNKQSAHKQKEDSKELFPDLGSPAPAAPEVDETKAEDGPRIEAELKHIFAIAPDEIHVRELLKPIEKTGKERLRETGVRARAFRALFEPWEELHVMTNDKGSFIRDDIVTYLRQAKDLSGISTSRNRAEIIRAYENYRYFLTKLSSLLFPWTAPYFADHMTLHAHLKHGRRGIVLSGGDGQLGYLMTSAKSIRSLGCTLPIEVMYLGDDDLGDDSRAELEAIPDVITRDMKQMVTDKGWDLKGWAGKPFAMLLSSFREVLFIDADAMFFHNPAILFDDPSYVETGALFFKDRLMFPESKRKWLQQILPKPVSRRVRQSRFWTGESGHMQESGVVVVDKWRHFMALLMVTRMNGPDRDGNKAKGIIGIYDMVYGDKETFWLGWELVGDHDYAFHPGNAGNMGVAYADLGDSPKIADTAAMLSKHVELGDLAGHYQTTLRSPKKQKHREQKGRKAKDKQAPAPEPAAGADEATKGDKDFKIYDDKDVHGIADAPRPREYEETNQFGDEDEDDSDDEDGDADKPSSADETAKGAGKPTETPTEKPKANKKKEPPPKRDIEGIEDLHLSEDDNDDDADDRSEDEVVTDKKQHVKRGVIGPQKPKGVKADKKAAVDTGAKKTAVDGQDKDEVVEPPSPKGQPMMGDAPLDVNYTICAPQLLHLGRDGRPLWFNGWILDNKFDKKHASPSKFSVFLSEEREDNSPAQWMLQKNNMCCLQSDKIHRFTVKEKQTLKMIVDTARDVGAFGKKHAG